MICSNLDKCIEANTNSSKLQKCDNHNETICVQSADNRSSVKCEEHGKKYVYENTKKNRIIVTSSTPNLKASPAYVNLQKMLRQTYGGNIKIFERQLFEKDIELEKQ